VLTVVSVGDWLVVEVLGFFAGATFFLITLALVPRAGGVFF
jgi:hypothetical protein